MYNRCRNWMEGKVRISKQLAAGGCGGGYDEAAMVLCAAISALAAELWPGKNKDRARFVQVLVDFSPSDLAVTTLSIPLLIDGLTSSPLKAEAATLKKEFLQFDPSRIIDGEDIDRPESEVRVLCPNIPNTFLRKFSYASLLYEEIRSAYVHEYSTGRRADSWPMSARPEALVSYVNWGNDQTRHIHFQIEWIARVAIAIARSIDAAAPTFPLPDPDIWWLQGATDCAGRSGDDESLARLAQGEQWTE